MSVHILMLWSKGGLAMLTDKDSSGMVNVMSSWEEIDAAGGGCTPVKMGRASVALLGVPYAEKNTKGQEVH